MLNLIVVDNSEHCKFNIDNVEVVSAKTYLINSAYLEPRNIRVYNLCRSYKYQSVGYYVSLLAQARGHKVFPKITTIQDLKSQTIIRLNAEDLDEMIQKSLAKVKPPSFDLSIYFGKNLATQYAELSRQLYNFFQAPLLRANFVYNKKWILRNINAISINDIPDNHQSYFLDFANQYFSKKKVHTPKKNKYLFDLGILVNPNEKNPPSNKKAISNFIDAAEEIGFGVELITKNDFGKIPELDALFIRETTSVNHHTYRFAQRAEAEGLVVIDDPESIVKCTNKVYLAELWNKSKIPRPKTLIIYRDNQKIIDSVLGFPCVLKQPDSFFSRGVVKVNDHLELKNKLNNLFEKSDLIIAQEFIPTDFDWRIGILNGQPLFACQYFMAEGHWQICNWQGSKKNSYGEAVTVPLTEVPPAVLKQATRVASLIGDGFYGVDLKVVKNNIYVMEINDNPNVDAEVEDKIDKEKTYLTVMQEILQRILTKKI